MTKTSQLPKNAEVILSAKETQKGYPVKNIRWSSIFKGFIGMVLDPNWKCNPIAQSNSGYSSCTWDKKGNCLNQFRPDCNLKLD
jgi:hypothetical protein